MKKKRIDKLLVDLGMANSRSKAQALVMAGVVLANERRVEKPSESFLPDERIRIKGKFAELKYVSRGGLKLEKALEAFCIRPNGYVCLDIGSSTGGFTDCLLQNGARKVYAIDAGINQIAWKLRNDKRVEVREKTNARYLKPHDFEVKFDLIVIDVSFISIKKIFPAIIGLMVWSGKLISLIKPQFEVGKGEVGKGGVVKDNEKRQRVLSEVINFARGIGFNALKAIESPILGAAGNKEFLVLYERTQKGKIENK